MPGVGRKVADCVAVFALDQPGCVPVDTHVWAIACRYMDESLKGVRSLTPAVHERVGGLFRDRFGAHAGWAHCLLFAAELPAFADLLPAEVAREQVRGSRGGHFFARCNRACRLATTEPPCPLPTQTFRRR